MAFDYGIQSLGIKNPFKAEGGIRTVCGTIVLLLGILALFKVNGALKLDIAAAWAYAVGGFMLLIWGLGNLGGGSFQLFRYFVGRSIPTSLAYNFSPSERENAEAEKRAVVYDAQKVESMLMGRKNSTFAEPIGWLSRLTHTVLPKLLFLPHLLRNYAQDLATMLASTITAIVAFALVYFISASGLIGEGGAIINQFLSVLLLIALLRIWQKTAYGLRKGRHITLADRGSQSIALLLAAALLGPILFAYFYRQLPADTLAQLRTWSQQVSGFNPWLNFLLLALVCAGAMLISWHLFRERFTLTNANTEVSEFRENLQESVHPNEVFINIENIVMANRRYKEIPNRVYQQFDPQLEEQSQGKGNFKGQLLFETQPEYRPIEYSESFKKIRLLATALGQLFVCIAAVLFFAFIGKLGTFLALAKSQAVGETTSVLAGLLVTPLVSNAFFGLLALFIAMLTFLAAGQILSSGAHLFWSEMHFSSLLVWMKTEGTFTESKVSTGMAIHDSTRSENVVVRSSITMWIITSRIISSTFATSGINNLEMPRYILTMDKNPQEMEQIVDEIKSFLRGRETIASIQNEKDLHNASKIFHVNQATKNQPLAADADQTVAQLSEMAGKFRRDQEGQS